MEVRRLVYRTQYFCDVCGDMLHNHTIITPTDKETYRLCNTLNQGREITCEKEFKEKFLRDSFVPFYDRPKNAELFKEKVKEEVEVASIIDSVNGAVDDLSKLIDELDLEFRVDDGISSNLPKPESGWLMRLRKQVSALIEVKNLLEV